MRIIAFLSTFAILSACGSSDEYTDKRTHPTPVPQPKTSDLVIIATASFSVNTAGFAATFSPATVVLAPHATFALNTSSFVIPTMSNAVLSFGSIAISALTANNLKVCGTGAQKCGHAYIRVYTTGDGAGFWNSDDALDSYGAPMTVTSSLTTVDLGSENAVAVQSVTIGAKQNTLKLANFPSPVYPFGGDFTEAGAGNYHATINIELALGL